MCLLCFFPTLYPSITLLFTSHTSQHEALILMAFSIDSYTPLHLAHIGTVTFQTVPSQEAFNFPELSAHYYDIPRRECGKSINWPSGVLMARVLVGLLCGSLYASTAWGKYLAKCCFGEQEEDGGPSPQAKGKTQELSEQMSTRWMELVRWSALTWATHPSPECSTMPLPNKPQTPLPHTPVPHREDHLSAHCSKAPGVPCWNRAQCCWRARNASLYSMIRQLCFLPELTLCLPLNRWTLKA